MKTGLTRIQLGAALVGTAAILAALPAAGQTIFQGDDFLRAISRSEQALSAQSESEPIQNLLATVDPATRDRWASFQLESASEGGEWVGYVDKRTGRLDYAEGAGIPWIPGGGNRLTDRDVAQHLHGGKVDTGTLESIARAFLPKVAALLGVEASTLVLNPDRSGQLIDYLWYVDFDVVRDTAPIEGARVVFRINHGNLIQFGSENLPAPATAKPEVRVTKGQALAVLSDHIGGVTPWDEFVDAGSLHLIPVALVDDRFADGFAFGRGRGLAEVWQFVFRRDDALGTWRARIDATTGELLEFRDVNDYGQVTGGVYLTLPAAGETVKPMPFADVAASTYANSAGLFSSGSASALNGQYVQIVDSCGSISRSTNGSGNIVFGTSTGTDCTTPGSGGAGNTHAARTAFYHLNRIKEMVRGWLPTNTWVNAKLTSNTDLTSSCNGFWNGSTVNFYRTGTSSNGPCGNAGELSGFVLHEFGHGLDSNDGNGGSDSGTGESYGDVTAVIGLRNSCVGGGFYLSNNCTGYGDACTGCNGLRETDWAKHASGVPHTVSNYTQVRCTSAGSGPCNREGHCESHISSEAIWDLAARDLPSPNTNASWLVVDRLWYLSRPTATRAFNCTPSGTWTSNGCFTGSWWRTMRAVDDDDGNLNNGTPHGGALYTAFNRHGIACTTDTGASTTFVAVARPAIPTLTLANGPGANKVNVSWTNSGTGVVYDVYRNEVGCSSGFAKVANDRTGTLWTDSAVVNGSTYYYQVVAHPSGTEAASANPTQCKSIIPSGIDPFVVTATVPDYITVKATYSLTGSASHPATNWKWERSDDSGATYYLWANSQNSQFVAYAGQYVIYWRLSATRISDGATDSDVKLTYVCTLGSGCIPPL